MDEHCPGTDMRYWKPEDIACIPCPVCGAEVEIWKDEPMRHCPSCKQPVRNPRMPADCENWCSLALHCPGIIQRRQQAEHEITDTPG